MLLILALLAVDPATTAVAPPSPPVAEKKVCRRGATTGSMMPQRICHFATEWAAIDEANAEKTGRFNENKNDSRGSY